LRHNGQQLQRVIGQVAMGIEEANTLAHYDVFPQKPLQELDLTFAGSDDYVEVGVNSSKTLVVAGLF
jgi:hypothetical protein